MPYEQLIESVEVSAKEKISELKEKTYREATEITKEAESKDESIRMRYLEAVNKAVEIERNEAIVKIKEETRMKLIRVKDEMYQKAFSEAKAILSPARENANYENSFRKMLKEAAAELAGEEIRLHIDKRDENLCKKLLPELHLNCEIATDLTCAGGLNASTKDERFIVFNTIESRFERAKALLRSEIFATLYGDQGGL
ncbi:MAG: V-type ATP synthase subunit E family protein [Methanoregula sp.]|nr:V-type ATP synthase subunit E family protein [Methanoregula sp.]